MRRREFVAGLGAAAWPLPVRAQQRAMPVIGFLSEAKPVGGMPEPVLALHRGLSDIGYVEGRNVAVLYRWAEEHLERLPTLVDDLVRSDVAIIVTFTTPGALAAKAATKTIPIVFGIGSDPVGIGLVSSLSRPGGNITGISNLNVAVSGKRLEMLRELLPTAASIGYLVNPANIAYAAAETAQMQDAARTLGVRLLILNASDMSALEAAFVALVREEASGVVIGGDSLFFRNYQHHVALADRFRMPALYRDSLSVAAGGLMSYATDLPETWREASVYAGRILKGERPADLPVQQVTKMRLTLNVKTARALGLDFPLSILARADEVIE
jgi:putative tryptophan/tyrosine transport system substrate-binding protein